METYKKIKNLTIDELDEHLIVRRNGYNLGKFKFKNGTYYFIDSICNGSGKYYHEINTNCKTLKDAVAFISY